MSLAIAVLLLAVACSMTCALPGTFLVLRKQSMLVDAMSHAVLPGIAVGALISGSTRSPIMIALASAMGLVVVWGASWLRSTGLITGDANQGLIFPALFALGVLLLSTVLSSVRLDEDSILSGDLNLNALPQNHLIFAGLSFGPAALWQLVGVTALNVAFLAVFYRVIKVSSFDPSLARVMGFPVRAAEWGFMLCVAITVVVAFETAGAILVVALIVVPPATAQLVAKSLPQMLVITQVVALASACAGFAVAYVFDLPTAALMAVIDGLLFLAVLLAVRVRHRLMLGKAAAPREGNVATS